MDMYPIQTIIIPGQADALHEELPGSKGVNGGNTHCVKQKAREKIMPHLPDEVVELLLKILDIRPSDSLMHLGCGDGAFLSMAGRGLALGEVVGIEMSKEAAVQARDTLGSAGHEKVLLEDSLMSRRLRKRGAFDKLFCCPPMDVHDQNAKDTLEVLADFQKEIARVHVMAPVVLERSVHSNWAYAVFCSMVLEPGGRAVVLMPMKAFSSRNGFVLRQALLADKRIRGVIQLPTLFSWKAKETALVVLGAGRREGVKGGVEGSGKVRLVDATGLGEAGHPYKRLTKHDLGTILEAWRGKDSDIACSVSPGDLMVEHKTDMVPSHHLRRGQECVQGVALGELATLRRGRTLSTSERGQLFSLAPTECCLITQKMLANGQVDDSQSYLRAIPPHAQAAVARPDDIIIMTHTQPPRCYRVRKDEKRQLLVDGNLCIITPKRVDADYLLAFLESAPGQQQLTQLMVGTTHKMLSADNLRTLRIPLPADGQMSVALRRVRGYREEIAALQAKARLVQAKLDCWFAEEGMKA